MFGFIWKSALFTETGCKRRTNTSFSRSTGSYCFPRARFTSWPFRARSRRVAASVAAKVFASDPETKRRLSFSFVLPELSHELSPELSPELSFRNTAVSLRSGAAAASGPAGVATSSAAPGSRLRPHRGARGHPRRHRRRQERPGGGSRSGE